MFLRVFVYVFRAVDRENMLGDFNGVTIIISYMCLLGVASKFQRFGLFDSGSRGCRTLYIMVSHI